MNLKLTAALSLTVLLCFGLVGQSLAQTHMPGVQPGDEFVYGITSYWSSSNASLTAPVQFLDVNNTLWYNVTVSYVQETNVTAMTAQHFVNNTEDNRLITLDVESDTMYFMEGFRGFYLANLSVNDLLHPTGEDGEDGLRVNETVSREYASGKRDTNVVTISGPSTLASDPTNTTVGTTTITYYIDKATGVLVERKDFTEFPDQSGTEQHWVLKWTSLWTITTPVAEFPLPIPVLIAIVVVVVVAISATIFYKKWRTRPKRHRR